MCLCLCVRLHLYVCIRILLAIISLPLALTLLHTQEIKLQHLAVVQYQRALELYDNHPELAACNLHVTREAAYNLMLLYKRSDADALVFELMYKYLTF
jgi:hypothetical protein